MVPGMGLDHPSGVQHSLELFTIRLARLFRCAKLSATYRTYASENEKQACICRIVSVEGRCEVRNSSKTKCSRRHLGLHRVQHRVMAARTHEYNAAIA